MRRILATAALLFALCLPGIARAQIAITHLTTDIDESSGTSYNTASISPGANKLILAIFSEIFSASNGDSAPVVTGNGLTWTQQAGTFQGSTRRTQIFRALTGASPSSGVVNIVFDLNQGAVGWSIFEVENVDLGGTNGSNAIVQSLITKNDSSVTSATITLPNAFGATENAAVGMIAIAANGTAPTPGSGFNAIGSNNSTDGLRIQSQWKNSNDTTVDWTYTTTTSWLGWAAELKYSAPGAGGTTIRHRVIQ